MSDRKKRILIVEDEKPMANALQFKLEQAGFNVFVLNTGEGVVTKAENNAFDLILLDLILPEKDGFHVLESLKEDPQTQNIPVIVLSNLGQDSDVEKAKNLGAQDYLIKTNVSLSEIVEEVKEFL